MQKYIAKIKSEKVAKISYFDYIPNMSAYFVPKIIRSCMKHHYDLVIDSNLSNYQSLQLCLNLFILV